MLADFSYVNGYKSSTTKKKKNLSHLFINFDRNLNLDNFNKSDLLLSIEKVTNDTYLKVFDAHITKSPARPGNLNNLNNQYDHYNQRDSYKYQGEIPSYLA